MLFARTPIRRFTSQYGQGPRLKLTPQLMGFQLSRLRGFIPMAAGMGVAAGIAVVFFAEEIPPMRHDVLENLPIIGGYWKKEIPPEDNPF